MCFGPVPSIAAAVVLAGLGAVTIRSASEKRQYLFAALPIIFALHQLTEGFLWLALLHEKPSPVTNALVLAFLTIALIIFPTFCPASVYLFEKKASQRSLLLPFVVWGCAVSSFFFFPLFRGEYGATIRKSCIYYQVNINDHDVLVALAYIVATVFPMFLSSSRAIKHVGTIFAICCAAAAFWYYEEFLSVWCFAAAIVSSSIYLFFSTGKANSDTGL